MDLDGEEEKKVRKESTKSEGRKFFKTKMNTFQNLDREPNQNPSAPYHKKQLRKRNSEKFFERKVEIYGKKRSEIQNLILL